jgi:hypothetical protein
MSDKRTDLMIRHSKINNTFFGKETIMEQYEVESKINGLRNWKINFGSHTVALGRRDRTPDRWVWSLWGGADGWELIDSGALTFEGLKINAHQVARVIMLLTVDYADAPERPEPVAPEPTETTF